MKKPMNLIRPEPIKEYSFMYDKTTDKVAVKKTAVNSKRPGPIMEKAKSISSLEQPLVTVVSKIDTKLPEHAKLKMQAYLNVATREGIKTKNGMLKPVVMGTNALMKNTVHYGPANLVDELRNWQFCGADFEHCGPQNMAKLIAYGGLVLPYTMQLINGKLHPKYEVLIPAWDHTIRKVCILFNPDGTMKNIDSTVICEFDGQCVLDPSEEVMRQMGLDKEQWAEFRRLVEKFNGGTLRAPFQKGLIITGVRFRDMLKKMGVTHIQGRPVDEIAIFGDAKVFKAALGESGLFKNFEQYCMKFEELGHRFGLLLENHGVKSTFLPAQQLNAVVGGDIEHIREGAKQEIAYLRAAKDPIVASKRYGNSFTATMIKTNPEFAKVWFAEELLNSGYQNERKTSLAGRTHGENYAGFVCKDVVAFAQWIAYCEGVRTELPTGCLDSRTVFCASAPEKMYIASRNPVVALYGLVEVENTHDLGEWTEYFDEKFPYIMVPLGDISMLLRMDYDGDKARLSGDEWFINLVRSAKANAGPDIEIPAEWTGFGEPYKAIPNDDAFATAYASATAESSLGRNVSSATKCATHWEGGNVPAFQRNADYMMNKGTDVKQGADGSTAEGDIGVDWNDTAKRAGELKFTKAHAAAKELKRKEGDPELDPEKIDTEWGTSPADLLNMAVTMKTPDKLSFGGNYELCVQWMYKFIRNRPQVIKGLCTFGKKNNETGEYEDEGLLLNRIFRSKQEWAAICEDDKAKYDYDAWKAWKKQEVYDDLLLYAVKNGKTSDDVYDAIVTFLFSGLANTWYAKKTTEGKQSMLMILARQIIEWFGDDMIAQYEANANKPVEHIEVVIEDEDEDEPV